MDAQIITELEALLDVVHKHECDVELGCAVEDVTAGLERLVAVMLVLHRQPVRDVQYQGLLDVLSELQAFARNLTERGVQRVFRMYGRRRKYPMTCALLSAPMLGLEDEMKPYINRDLYERVINSAAAICHDLKSLEWLQEIKSIDKFTNDILKSEISGVVRLAEHKRNSMLLHITADKMHHWPFTKAFEVPIDTLLGSLAPGNRDAHMYHFASKYLTRISPFHAAFLQNNVECLSMLMTGSPKIRVVWDERCAQYNDGCIVISSILEFAVKIYSDSPISCSFAYVLSTYFVNVKKNRSKRTTSIDVNLYRILCYLCRTLRRHYRKHNHCQQSIISEFERIIKSLELVWQTKSQNGSLIIKSTVRDYFFDIDYLRKMVLY